MPRGTTPGRNLGKEASTGYKGSAPGMSPGRSVVQMSRLRLHPDEAAREFAVVLDEIWQG
ncbi:MAG: hypothetical protein ACRDQ4_03665 [Pseudonocardiaceae bacterium]